MKRGLAILACFLITLAAPCCLGEAQANAMNDADAKAIQSVVQSQLDAFAQDDAAHAFALATSSTRQQLGSADNFLTLVREMYRPVYRNRLAIFATPEIVNGQVIQAVRLTDPDSRVWIAIYWMERESDGDWKIDNCQLLATESISI